MHCGGFTGASCKNCQCHCWPLVFKHVVMRRRTCVVLEFIAHKKTDTELTEQNKQAMALTHGFAHGVVQSVLFSIRSAPSHCCH